MENATYETSTQPVNSELNVIQIITLEDIKNRQEKAIRRLIRKLDLRLIPFLALLQFFSYIHQISIGHAEILNLKDDFNLTRQDGILAISLFFVGYVSLEIPSNLLLRIIGPTNYLSISMFCWGTITVVMAVIKNKSLFLTLRLLLGMAESGFFPGMIVYISLWYRKPDRIMRIILFFLAVPTAGAVGGILAYVIAKIPKVDYIEGWRWILLLEGLPIIPLGLITYFFLANIPETVRWLNVCEQQILTNILRKDAGIADSEPESNNLLSWRQVRYAFTDWRVYLYALISTGNLGVIRLWTVYFPSFVLIMSSNPNDAHWWSAPPYVVAAIYILIIGFSSSRNYEIGYHLSFSLFVSALGFCLMATVGENSIVIMYISITIACAGTFAAFPILLSWVTINVGGRTKRALAVGFVSGFGKIGGIVAPWAYEIPEDCETKMKLETNKTCVYLIHSSQGQFRQGHIICASATFITVIIALLLRFLLKAENNRREHLTEAARQQEIKIEEPCDWHPDVRYKL